MDDQSPSFADAPASEPVLLRTLAAAGLPATGRFASKRGWASRAWVGDEYVVRLSNRQARDPYGHEAKVVALLASSDVPHARHIAHGISQDGPWYISERLRGRTLHDEWPEADVQTRRAIIESLGDALRLLHRVPVPANLLPPWLADALDEGSWPAYRPPVVRAALDHVEAARRLSVHDCSLLDDVAVWIEVRLPMFALAGSVLVHGDLHGSNVMVDQGQVTGLIDFAVAMAQPSDVELDTILRWCARSGEFPPTPDTQGLERSSPAQVPGWLRGAYPDMFNHPHLRERLNLYDMCVELAIYAHHPEPGTRAIAHDRLALLLSGHNHLDQLSW